MLNFILFYFIPLLQFFNCLKHFNNDHFFPSILFRAAQFHIILFYSSFTYSLAPQIAPTFQQWSFISFHIFLAAQFYVILCFSSSAIFQLPQTPQHFSKDHFFHSILFSGAPFHVILLQYFICFKHPQHFSSTISFIRYFFQLLNVLM